MTIALHHNIKFLPLSFAMKNRKSVVLIFQVEKACLENQYLRSSFKTTLVTRNAQRSNTNRFHSLHYIIFLSECIPHVLNKSIKILVNKKRHQTRPNIYKRIYFSINEK